jgi:hypothetical protein
MGIKLYCVHYEKEGFYADFEAVKKLHKIMPKKLTGCRSGNRGGSKDGIYPSRGRGCKSF